MFYEQNGVFGKNEASTKGFKTFLIRRLRNRGKNGFKALSETNRSTFSDFENNAYKAFEKKNVFGWKRFRKFMCFFRKLEKTSKIGRFLKKKRLFIKNCPVFAKNRHLFKKHCPGQFLLWRFCGHFFSSVVYV